MTKKNKVWTIKEADSFLKFLEEYDLVTEAKSTYKEYIITLNLKIDDSNGERDNTSD